MRIGNLILTTLVAFAACASTMEVDRREYILSRPHGWIELTIADDSIPPVPESDEHPNELVRPEWCYVETRLDREPYSSIQVFPAGDRAPFTVRSGLRFPVPLGPALLSVTYSGCKGVEDGDAKSITAQLYVAVEDSRVTDVAFDGSALTAAAPRDDSVVTLDDVYEAVTGHPKN